MMQPEQGNPQGGDLRFTEGMPIQDYTRLLDKLITSANSTADFAEVGLWDNTSIYLPSDNSQQTFDQIVADLGNPKIFANYEPAGSEYPTSDGVNPRRIFFKDSQFVQLRIYKETGQDIVAFSTSHHKPPAGFTKDDYIGKNTNAARQQAYRLAQQKEHTTVVNSFLRYCEKKDMHGSLGLYFPETLKESKLSF